ncbi:MAG: DinB family protein [Armatimonadetes bacterium]|nr:DinB family protein [Armatimonadota bacterium]
MTTVEYLRHLSQFAHNEVVEALDGVTEKQAWAVLPQRGSDYLHSDGSIHGITLHIASAKIMYASMSFRNTEIRLARLRRAYREVRAKLAAALDYLGESQRYWLETWKSLTDDELTREVDHFSGRKWPVWQAIRTMIHHDSWHGGQLVVLRYACPEFDQRPPSVAEDIRTHCGELPSW